MINWIVSSSVLILIVIGMRYFFKGKISAKLQYALWLLVAVRLLVPVSFGNSMLSIENITNRIFPNTEDTLVQDMAQEHGFADEDIDEVIYQDQTVNMGVPGTDVNEETIYVPKENSTSDANVWFWIWLIGVGCTAGVFLMTNIVFQKKIKKSRSAIYVNWCRRPVYVSKEVEIPCLVGVFSPIIYVTEEVAQNTLLLRHTVTHEEMHYKQGDNLWALIRCVCLALHWYNPLVWLAAILSKKDAEFSCDEATIKALGEEERKEYGKTLIQLSSREKYNVFLTATAMTSGKRSIKERIVFIAKKPKVKWYTLVVCILISCVAIGCTFTQGENQDNNSGNYVDEIETQNDITENIDQSLPVDTSNSEADYWEKPDKDKVCLAVMPDGISTAGGDYRYIIPEDQTKWMDGYKQTRSLASGNGKWKEDECSMGVWIVYGEEWTCITDQGFIYAFEKRVEKTEAEDFYNLCMEEARKNGTGTPARPENFTNITYAKILGEYSFPIRDEYVLDEIEKSLRGSTELRGGSGCPFTIPLYLELDNKESIVIYLASDSCSAWLSDGVYYEDSYGAIAGLKDMIAARQMVMEFTMAYFKNDIETLQAYMMPTSSVKVSGYSESEEIPGMWSFRGLESCIDASKWRDTDFKTKVFVDFQVPGETEDTACLKIFIRKCEGEWKVEAYMLEQ